MAESSHAEDRSFRVEKRAKCAACSRRFEDPRLLSCHHTFCRACLQLSVNNNRVTCPACRTVHNLSADGLEGLPSSPEIILLLKLVNARESLDSLAIRERHVRDRNPQHRTPEIAMVTPSRTGSDARHGDIAMVTPPRTDSDARHGDIAMVTPSMPGYAERRGTVFIDRDVFLGGQPDCIAVSPAADRLYVTVVDHHSVLIFDDRGTLMKTARGPDVSPGAGPDVSPGAGPDVSPGAGPDVIPGAGPRGGKLGFDHPRGIAVNKDGDVIVADYYNHRVVVLDRDGEYQFSFGTHGENDGQLDCPWGVAVDDVCSIYVCDEHRVQVFTRYGKYLRTFEKPDNVAGGFPPMYLSIARTTGRVYVTAYSNHRVYVYTPLGRCITCFGTRGSGEGEMYQPRGICVDDDGRVIITDDANDRVQVFNGAGTYHCTLVLAHDTPPLSLPVDLTIDKNGRVFVVDADNKHVLVF